VFLSWIGDHGRHVHVFRNGREILKWDVEENAIMKGRPTRKLLRLIETLMREERI